MIAVPEHQRRRGLSGLAAISIVIACAAFVLALLAVMPDS
jgi:hypothetical protein